MRFPTDGTTGFTAVAQHKTWPQIKFDIGDMDTTLTSALGRRFREGPKMLQTNI